MRGEDPSPGPGPGPGLDPLQELGWPAAAVAIKCCGVCWWRCPLSLLLDPGAGGSRDRGRAPWGSQHPGTEQGGLGLWRWSPWRPPRRRAGTPQLTAWGQHDSPCTRTPRGPCQKEDCHRHRARLKAARSRAERSTRPWRGKYSLGSTATLIQTSQLPHSPLLGCFRGTRLWAWDVYVSRPAWLWHRLRALGRQDSFARTAAPCPHVRATSWPSWALIKTAGYHF